MRALALDGRGVALGCEPAVNLNVSLVLTDCCDGSDSCSVVDAALVAFDAISSGVLQSIDASGALVAAASIRTNTACKLTRPFSNCVLQASNDSRQSQQSARWFAAYY